MSRRDRGGQPLGHRQQDPRHQRGQWWPKRDSDDGDYADWEQGPDSPTRHSRHQHGHQGGKE